MATNYSEKGNRYNTSILWFKKVLCMSSDGLEVWKHVVWNILVDFPPVEHKLTKNSNQR